MYEVRIWKSQVFLFEESARQSIIEQLATQSTKWKVLRIQNYIPPFADRINGTWIFQF